MKCSECGGACCEELEIVPNARHGLPDEDWLEAHHGKIIAGRGGEPRLRFELRCIHLTSNGYCGIYANRPFTCRVYPAGGYHCLDVVKRRRTPKDYERIREKGDPKCLV